jgi:hypothetical protein
MSAEGVSGNAARLSAALELAAESPDMSAEKVIAFAVKNVPESVAPVSAALANRANLPDSLASVGGAAPAKAFNWAEFRAKRGR